MILPVDVDKFIKQAIIGFVQLSDLNLMSKRFVSHTQHHKKENLYVESINMFISVVKNTH